MDNFMFAVNAVLPLFVMMGFGYLIRQKRWLPEGFAEIFNRFCFDFALPCSLFRTTYNSNIAENFNPVLIGAMTVLILFELLVGALVFPLFVKERPKLGTLIQASFRTNAVILGLPLGRNLFGEQNMLPMTLIVATSVPLFNLMAVLVLSLYGDNGGKKVNVMGLFKQIITNRLILATIFGLGFSLLNIKLPAIVMSPVGELANASGPLAMMALGAHFSFENARQNRMLNSVAVLVRLVALPLMITPVLVWLGFRGPELGSLYILSAAPVATTSFIIARNMGCDSELAGEIVVLSTFCSVFTIFGGVLLLRSFGLI